MQAMTEETRQNIVDGFFRLGVPCVVLAAVLWMCREAAFAVHTSVVIPVVKGHTEYLEATRQALTGIEKTQQQQAVTMERIAKGQDEIRDLVKPK